MAVAHNSMRMKPYNVVLGGMKLGRFHNLDRKVVRKILEELPVTNQLNPPPPLLGREPIIVVPDAVEQRYVVVVGEDEVDEEEEHAEAHEEEAGGVVQDCHHLEATLPRNVQGNKLYAKHLHAVSVEEKNFRFFCGSKIYAIVFMLFLKSVERKKLTVLLEQSPCYSHGLSCCFCGREKLEIFCGSKIYAIVFMLLQWKKQKTKPFCGNKVYTPAMHLHVVSV